MRRYLFADEAGDFEFSRHQRASKYFIICTIATDDCSLGHTLSDLRRQLAWDNFPLRECFHCSEDKQKVRDAVFDLIRKQNIWVGATIMEKSKAQPQVRINKPRFYQYGWFYHLKYTIKKVLKGDAEFHVTAASVTTKKEQAHFTGTVNDVVQQVTPGNVWKTSFWPAATDPCLQIADYCTWAIQRKWERGDTRAYDLIKHMVHHEYDLWAHGKKYYY